MSIAFSTIETTYTSTRYAYIFRIYGHCRYIYTPSNSLLFISDMELSEHWLISMTVWCPVVARTTRLQRPGKNVLYEDYILIFWFSGVSEYFIFLCALCRFITSRTLHHWAYWWLSLWLELHSYAFPVYCCIIYMFKERDNKESKLYVIQYKWKDHVFIFLLTLDDINQKQKLHANNTRDCRVP